MMNYSISSKGWQSMLTMSGHSSAFPMGGSMVLVAATRESFIRALCRTQIYLSRRKLMIGMPFWVLSKQ